MSKRLRTVPPLLVLLISALVLQGCVGTELMSDVSAPEAGFLSVETEARHATRKTSVWVQSREEADALATKVTAMVKGKTIDADTAVQVSLLNNKGLQAAYADIGLSAANVWQTSLPLNPKVSIGVLGIGAPEVGLFRAIEGLVTTNVLAMMTRERRLQIAETEFQAAQLKALNATL